MHKSKEWLHAIESLERNENYNFFQTLQNIANRAKLLPMEGERQKLFESMGADSEGKLSLSSLGCIDAGISGSLKRKKMGSVNEIIKKIKEDPCITEHEEHILKAQLLCWNDKSKISAISMSGWYTRAEESKIVYHCGKCSEIARKKRTKQHQYEKRQYTNEPFKLEMHIKQEHIVSEEDAQIVHETFDDFEDVDNEYDEQMSDADNETDQDSKNSHDDDDEEGTGDAFIGDSDDNGYNEKTRKNGYEHEKNSNSKKCAASYSNSEDVQTNMTSLQRKCYKQNMCSPSANDSTSNVIAATVSPTMNPAIF